MGKPAKCHECGNLDVARLPRISKKFVKCNCGNKVIFWIREDKVWPVCVAVKNIDPQQVALALRAQIQASRGSYSYVSHQVFSTTARDFNGGWQKIIFQIRYPVAGSWPDDFRKAVPRWIEKAGLPASQVEYHGVERNSIAT